jgi:REP element-mobilizing transposase RayT
MARANRHFIPGYVWHITHRCHKKDFLLKFVRDRKRWIDWLFEAKKRFDLGVLNYMVTSNHIHLLVHDVKGRDTIPKSVQLVAARTAQEYNNRKQRKGAFWEDRYHATAVEKNFHLNRCLVYMDLNMVRAGVVDHPRKWPFSGYKEIQNPPHRYRIIDLDRLVMLMGFTNLKDFQLAHKRWIEASLSAGDLERESLWTESLAVGSKSFIAKTKKRLGIKARGRAIRGGKQHYQLREQILDFGQSSLKGSEAVSWGNVEAINTFFWDEKA